MSLRGDSLRTKMRRSRRGCRGFGSKVRSLHRLMRKHGHEVPEDVAPAHESAAEASYHGSRSGAAQVAQHPDGQQQQQQRQRQQQQATVKIRCCGKGSRLAAHRSAAATVKGEVAAETRTGVRGAAVKADEEHARARPQTAGDRSSSDHRVAADGLNGESRWVASDIQQGRDAHESVAHPAGGLAAQAHRGAAGRTAEVAAELQVDGSGSGAVDGDDRRGALRMPRKWRLRGHEGMTVDVEVWQRSSVADWIPVRAVAGLRLWKAMLTTMSWLTVACVYGCASGAWMALAVAVTVLTARLWSNPSTAVRGAEPQVQSGQRSDTGNPEAVAAMPISGKQGKKSRSKKAK